ncbi:HTH-type transcriptional repressor KstR2 [Pseudomonas fluorescens]|uniref:HTH-type transcriptional repressor KstR2 n=1 Tax=Pseudomonas fluorescens TaxID=294 RepID=A0A5E6RKM5_PSEFL|nr:TetR/AcrR family transcriptional regulator [Pseudomonas fluorescens]VVM68641.1 HTH-type transcriptional repressor KstR2 [Pseudomonas fluorescens]
MPATSASVHPAISTRDRLLDAALELFATRGFQAIGLRDLASHVGLHAGSLYHHIENKQSLLFELIESALSDLLSVTINRMRGARNPGKRLQLFIQAFATFNMNEKYKLILITQEFANLDEDQKLRIVELQNRYSSLLSGVLTDHYREEGKPPADVCMKTNTIILMLFGQSQWYATEATESQLVKTLTTLATSIISYN